MNALTWAIIFATIGAIIVRPWRQPEWMWALGGAAALVALRIVSVPEAFAAIGRGSEVSFFLFGMLVLGELARASGLFDWLATIAVVMAGGSAARFYTLVFIVGVVVTAVLSNDATAVVLTPAVAAAARRDFRSGTRQISSSSHRRCLPSERGSPFSPCLRLRRLP
jgi:arsenical pump membrane protein